MEIEPCSICLCKIECEKKTVLTCCNKIYHNECIEHWKLINRSCPLCRSNIITEQDIRDNPNFYSKEFGLMIPKYNELLIKKILEYQTEQKIERNKIKCNTMEELDQLLYNNCLKQNKKIYFKNIEKRYKAYLTHDQDIRIKHFIIIDNMNNYIYIYKETLKEFEFEY
jgi:hypothetical protein